METALLERIKAAGIVGAGGAGFPTVVKLQAQPEVIIINGAECEPLLRVDQMLMARYAAELASALQAVVEDRGARAGIFALKEKYTEAYAALQNAIRGYDKLKLAALPDVYPAGDEHILVYHVLKKPIPSGHLPISVGAVVMNVETLYNVYQASQGRPVTHKFVTVTGAVAEPCTVKVPLGLPIRDLLSYAGGALVENYVLINGGPCMGVPTTEDAPVTKTTKGILVIPQDHLLAKQFRNRKNAIKQGKALCCHCQDCTDRCPRQMLGNPVFPHQAMQAVGYKLANSAAVKGATLCSECGVCEMFVCPFGLSPREVNRQIKQELQKAGVRFTWPAEGQKVDRLFDMRQIPTKTVLLRLGLKKYDKPAPWKEVAEGAQLLRLPLKQGAGRPAVPVVQPGAAVTLGELIAEAPEGIGAPLHASIQGIVKQVGTDIIIERQEGVRVWMPQ